MEAAVWKSGDDSSCELGKLHGEQREKIISQCFPDKNSERKQESCENRSNRSWQVCGDFQFQSINSILQRSHSPE